MAFKMKGFNPGKGTGMGSGLTYVPQSLRGKFDDHPDKKDNVNYDEGGRPEVKGGIDFSTIDPRNSKFFNINKRTDRMVVEPTDKELERAIAFYKKMEQKLGPGQVARNIRALGFKKECMMLLMVNLIILFQKTLDFIRGVNGMLINHRL